MWNMKVKVVLVVTGALETPKALEKRLESIDIDH